MSHLSDVYAKLKATAPDTSLVLRDNVKYVLVHHGDGRLRIDHSTPTPATPEGQYLISLFAGRGDALIEVRADSVKQVVRVVEYLSTMQPEGTLWSAWAEARLTDDDERIRTGRWT